MTGPDFIPALSFRQPWIWTIFECGKRIENRVWRRRFRGEFLIHASKGMTRGELEDGYMFARHVGTVPGKWRLDPPTKAELQFGGIVGRARIDGDPLLPRWPRSLLDDGITDPWRITDPWHMTDQYGYPLSAVERLVDADGAPTIIPWRGELGFFSVSRADLAAAMDAGQRFISVEEEP